jgi:hypothetical protein
MMLAVGVVGLDLCVFVCDCLTRQVLFNHRLDTNHQLFNIYADLNFCGPQFLLRAHVRLTVTTSYCVAIS